VTNDSQNTTDSILDAKTISLEIEEKETLRERFFQRSSTDNVHDDKKRECELNTDDDVTLPNQQQDLNRDEEKCIDIPELDEDESAHDLRNGIANADVISHNMLLKLPTMEELNSDLNYVQMNSLKDGINLSILTNRLIPPEKIVEEDETWDFDSLLHQMRLEINSEKEKMQQV